MPAFEWQTNVTRDIVQFVTEAVVGRCSVKEVFLEISQNSQENNCARVSFLINLLLLDEIQNTKKMKTRESKERKFGKKVREIGWVVLILK